MSAATAARWSRTSRPPWLRSIANAKAPMPMRGCAGSTISAPRIATCSTSGRGANLRLPPRIPPSSGDDGEWLGRLLCRPVRVLVDRIDDLRPHRDRQRVAHAFDHQEFRAGDRGRGVLAARRMYQGIDGAVNDERRRLHGAQPFLAATGGEDGAELPPDAGRIEAALETSLAAPAV